MVNVILFSNASASDVLIFSLVTSLSTEVWIRDFPLSRKVESDSYAIIDEWMLDLAAAVAAVWAMPCPMSPRPMTPNLSKLFVMGVEEK